MFNPASHWRSRTAIAAATGLATAALTVSAGAAAPRSYAAQPGGHINVYEVYPSLAPTTPGSDLFTGAITDVGSDTRNVSPGINKITLTKGSFEIDTAQLTPLPVLVDSHCAFQGGFTGPVTIVAGSGTGGYAGISGSANVIVHTYGTVPKLSTGCDTNLTHASGFSLVTGSGSVTFS
jgi:hypothetical protein